MRSTFAPIALAALAAANPMPQGVTSAISPDTSAPAGCSPDYDGEFQIQVVNVTSSSSKRSYQKRQSTALELKLAGGILTDAEGRTGYIAANRQFQFDAPAQTGAVYTAGWSVCSNGSLAIGGDAIFQQCLSGTFYNLYDEADSAQCTPVYIDVINGSGSASVMPDGQPTETPVASQIPDGQVTASAVSSAAPVSQIGDGQIQASTGAAPVTQIGDGQIQATTAANPVSVIPDGQPQAPTGSPVSQISDGQPQAPTGSAVQQITDGQIQAPTGSPVTQISDGQIQAPTGSPVTQISDGQIQAPTGSPVTQISDGQIQAPTGSPVTQISDGQIQAPTGAPVTQISDGQIQAPTGAPVTQISDGQIQAPTNGSSYASPTVQPYTGAGAIPTLRSELFGLAAGVLALAMF